MYIDHRLYHLMGFHSGLIIGVALGIVITLVVIFNCKLKKLDKEPAEKIIEMWKKVTRDK